MTSSPLLPGCVAAASGSVDVAGGEVLGSDEQAPKTSASAVTGDSASTARRTSHCFIGQPSAQGVSVQWYFGPSPTINGRYAARIVGEGPKYHWTLTPWAEG